MNVVQKIFLSTAFLLLLTFTGGTDALAQRSGGNRIGGAEFSATYGSMWGGNVNTVKGRFRTATGPSLGLALDIPLHRELTVELSYTRQDGALSLDDFGGLNTLTDMSVNYWQIGAIRSLTQGRVQPFLLLSFGLTYYSPEKGSITIDDEVFETTTSSKFSFVIGAGIKTWFGRNERIGFCASIKTLPTIYDAYGGLWFGSGGASVGFSGSAIWQWEAAAGLTVKLGG